MDGRRAWEKEGGKEGKEVERKEGKKEGENMDETGNDQWMEEGPGRGKVGREDGR